MALFLEGIFVPGLCLVQTENYLSIFSPFSAGSKSDCEQSSAAALCNILAQLANLVQILGVLADLQSCGTASASPLAGFLCKFKR